MKIVHSQGLNVLNMQNLFWFVSIFEHINFAINGKYSKNFYDNLNYYISLVIFQTYKRTSFNECPLIWVARLTMFLSQCILGCSWINSLYVGVGTNTFDQQYSNWCGCLVYFANKLHHSFCTFPCHSRNKFMDWMSMIIRLQVKWNK
jgi:hypothetical protein